MDRIVAFLIFISLCVQVNATQKYNIEDAWFKPYLEENHDEQFCSLFLKDATEYHLSSQEEAFIKSPYGPPNYQGLIGEKLENLREFKKKDERHVATEGWSISLNGEEYYLIYRGGHRRTVYEFRDGYLIQKQDYQRVIRNYESVRDAIHDPAFKKLPPNGHGFNVRIFEGSYYIFTQTGSHYSTFKLDVGTTWKKVCSVRYFPKKVSFSDFNLVNFIKLNNNLKNLMGNSGSCGSLRSHGRMSYQLEKLQTELLFRPWKFLSQETTFSDHSNSILFKSWGAVGPWNYGVYKNFHRNFPLAKLELKRFYVKQFDMEPEFAGSLASLALDNIVRTGGFTQGYYHQHTALNEAILEGKSIEDIERLELSSDRNIPLPGLHLAIAHPHLLKFFLERGRSPNEKNNFGKTPLMYAAQFNQLESAKLLLQYGADPNATTTKPLDNCNYTLRTHNITPLHYATRYASKQLIELLLENGAVTFFKSRKRDIGVVEEYPIDWLKKYTSQDNEEINPHINKHELEALLNKLKVPSQTDQESIIKRLLLRGEKEYLEGSTNDSYRTFKKLLNLDPYHEKALSNLSLVALRNNEFGESLEASAMLINRSKNQRVLASSWFNMGLACEKHSNEGKGRYVAFNGVFYCGEGFLGPFINSYIVKPSDTRREKIEELMQEGDINICSFYLKDNGTFEVFSYENRSLRNNSIYIFHPDNTEINPSDIYLEKHSWKDGKRLEIQAPVKAVNTYPLNNRHLTVVTARDNISKVFVKGVECTI